METFIALLRAVNVGGTGRLSMTELRKICKDEGLEDAVTYLASGNIVFRSSQSIPKIKQRLERGLIGHFGRSHIDIIIKRVLDVEKIYNRSPYIETPRQHSYVLFLDEDINEADLADIKGQNDEDITCGVQEIYVYYPHGMGKSKLVIPQAKTGTMRNMNTVAKLIEMAQKL